MYLHVIEIVLAPMVDKSVIDYILDKHRLHHSDFMTDLALSFPRLPFNIIREVTARILFTIGVDGLAFGMNLSFVKGKLLLLRLFIFHC